ncbi:MAG: hypothetical protein WC529_02045 [Candidatus Margulisiibacteriota bacterium]
MKLRNGQIAIISVFVLVTFAFLGLIIASLLSSGGVSALKNLHGIQALNVAEAGTRFTIATSLAADSDWSNNADYGPISFGPGTFTVHYVNKAVRGCTMEVTGTVQGVSRTVRTGLRKPLSSAGGLPGVFDYGMYIAPPGGGDTLYIEGDARVYGDFYYYGPIAMGGSAHQLDGTVYSTSISFSGTSSCASWEPISSGEIPPWDNTYYAAITREAMTSTSETLTLGWGQTLDLAGRTLYYRNIAINWGSTVIGPGTLCATATPSGNGDITINYGEGIGRNVRFIAQRDFIYQGGSSFVNTFEAYCNRQLRILSNLTIPSSVLYSGYTGDNAIEIDPAQVYRSVMLCPYGEFTFGGGQQIEGLVYADSIGASSSGTFRGAIVSYGTSTLGGSLHIYFDASYLPDSVIGFGGGTGTSSGELEVNDWDEVY